MPRKKKEEAPVKLQGYCPRFTQNIYSGQKYINYLNLADVTYLCAIKGYVGMEAPVVAVWKEEVREITEEEFAKDGCPPGLEL